MVKGARETHDNEARILGTCADAQLRHYSTDGLRKVPHICKSSLGRYNRAKAILQLKENARPVFKPKQPVSYTARALVELKVISKADYSTWATPVVVVKKPNIRYIRRLFHCLNDAIESH